MKTLKLTDTEAQREIFEAFEEEWKNFSRAMNTLQRKVTEKFIDLEIPLDQKLQSIEEELNELCTAFSDIRDNVENEEQFQLYLNRIQVSGSLLIGRVTKNIIVYNMVPFPATGNGESSPTNGERVRML